MLGQAGLPAGRGAQGHPQYAPMGSGLNLELDTRAEPLVLACATLVSLCPRFQIPLPVHPAQGLHHWKAWGVGCLQPSHVTPCLPTVLSPMATHTTQPPASWPWRAPQHPSWAATGHGCVQGQHHHPKPTVALPAHPMHPFQLQHCSCSHRAPSWGKHMSTDHRSWVFPILQLPSVPPAQHHCLAPPYHAKPHVDVAGMVLPCRC